MTNPSRGFCGPCSCLISGKPPFCAATPIGKTRHKTIINSAKILFIYSNQKLPSLRRRGGRRFGGRGGSLFLLQPLRLPLSQKLPHHFHIIPDFLLFCRIAQQI